MPNDNQLSGSILESAKSILNAARLEIKRVATGDPNLEFRVRRYVYIRLSYDERSSPLDRRRLKVRKFDDQNGLCGLCGNPLMKVSYSHLDRLQASLGYTAENTRLVHADCHHNQQKEKGYK